MRQPLPGGPSRAVWRAGVTAAGLSRVSFGRSQVQFLMDTRQQNGARGPHLNGSWAVFSGRKAQKCIATPSIQVPALGLFQGSGAPRAFSLPRRRPRNRNSPRARGRASCRPPDGAARPRLSLGSSRLTRMAVATGSRALGSAGLRDPDTDTPLSLSPRRRSLSPHLAPGSGPDTPAPWGSQTSRRKACWELGPLT